MAVCLCQDGGVKNGKGNVMQGDEVGNHLPGGCAAPILCTQVCILSLNVHGKSSEPAELEKLGYITA